MKNIIIVGAGGFGRELESYLTNLINDDTNISLKGYLDDNLEALEGKESNLKVLGKIDEYIFSENDTVLIAVASIDIKYDIVERLTKKKVDFFTFVDKSAQIGLGVNIGKGTVVCPNVIIPNNSSIGDFVTININTTVGHDSKIGNYCSIMPAVNIGGETFVGNNVFIGTNANILPRIKIVDKVFIGIGSIVIKSALESGTYFGNPARKMK